MSRGNVIARVNAPPVPKAISGTATNGMALGAMASVSVPSKAIVELTASARRRSSLRLSTPNSGFETMNARVKLARISPAEVGSLPYSTYIGAVHEINA
ncbi:hypothetical protein D3C86_2050360 [compost metagenome]